MINPWNGIVFFSEQLVDLGVVWLSDFFYLTCFTPHVTVSSSHSLRRAVWWTGQGNLVVQLVWD